MMQAVGDDQRASLVADIVGHPKGMPSVKELAYLNPGVEQSALAEHLNRLQAAGVIDSVELPEDDRIPNLPYIFYHITKNAREFFERNNIFDEKAWQDQYERVEKTDDIKRIETMERPESAVS